MGCLPVRRQKREPRLGVAREGQACRPPAIGGMRNRWNAYGLWCLPVKGGASALRGFRPAGCL
eukprot:3165894-Prymnesium_polylepis.1